MKFNTVSRRNIFVIIMSSRDINDAFERLSRLDLKGKQDREIIRVLVECCGQEKNYNAFYAELCSLLCHHNRQYKTTTQFTYWDFFKSLQEGTVSDRKVINLARLLSHLVMSFYLPLAIFKPLDMTTVPNNAVLLFLATFFMSLFSSDMSEERFQSIMDRVATTKDFAIIRDSLLFFLQKHLADLASNIETMNSKLIETRRKKAVKILESMNVLDMSAGLMDGDDDGMYDDR
jgi:nucleolar MIF4G domain-containing protein 1